MTDETSSRATRAVRYGVGAALLVVGVLVGGTVAFASTSHASDEPESSTADASGDTPHHHRHEHDHPQLPPYEQRYASASPEEQAAADALLADVRTTLAAYEDVDAAVAAGYQAPRHPRGPIAHYVNPSVADEGHLLDPSHPNGLVYYTGGNDGPVLLGAFFVTPPGTAAPTPAGDLVVWHSHNPGCPGVFATADAPCTDVRRMLHVWTAEQVSVASRRTGQPIEVQVTDPFGVPFGASVTRVS
jgi:hypothetical protein